MFNMDRSFLEQKAAETGFIRDNLEKVYRLIDILDFINGTPLLSDHLVLKGGTAINLTIFDLPRLSVDIDLDFCKSCDKNEMMEARERISSVLQRYMNASGYTQNLRKERSVHSLDSRVFYYQSTGGNRDNIKIEINYSMRCHILPIRRYTGTISTIDSDLDIHTLDPVELFGSKIKALLERTAARDLYDIHNMIREHIINEDEMNMLRKCVLFYRTVGCTGMFSERISLDEIHNMSYHKIRQTLIPVLRKREKIDLDQIKSEVSSFLETLLVFTPDEEEYINEFLLGNYHPELLFDDEELLKRIRNHPMAIWKTRNH